MRVMVGVFCTGLAVGVGATWLLLAGDGNSGSSAPVRDLEAARTMSVEVAEQHRQERYQDLDSLERILELPTRFSQREALYALAGRSSSGELQGLVFEASRIASDNDRDDALRIVFARLTELDPLSALALSRNDLFRYETDIEVFVWETWAHTDLENALFEAKTQTSASRQNLAAQAMFGAFNFAGDEGVDRIRSELRIDPDQANKIRFLLRIAERSPSDAIEHINGMASIRDQMAFIGALASHISRTDPDSISELASEFNATSHQQIFVTAGMQAAVAADPAPILERLISNGRAGLTDVEIMGALMSIAEKDLESAMLYFEDPALGAQHRQMLGATIAQVLAQSDVDQAVQWAKRSGNDQMNTVLIQVLTQVAMTDPQRAIDEAQALTGVPTRGDLLGQVLGVVASQDPQLAMGYLEQMPAGFQKSQAEQSVIRQWMARDSSGAVNWLLGTDPQTAGRFLSQSSMVVYQDVDAAQKLLPLVPPQQQRSWRQQIVRTLAGSGSSQEALDFVAQFKESKGYDDLQGQAISAIARHEPERALQLAGELPSGRARDRAYTSVVAVTAQRDPASAIPMLNDISDERSRGEAAGAIGMNWYLSDPVAANSWVDEMPAGKARDRAITTMANVWTESDDTTRRLISSIGDSTMRGQAKMAQIQRVMQTDPAAAAQMINDPDVPERYRKRLQEWLITTE